METKTVTPPSAPSSAEVAKAALRRLVVSRLEPTPENFARAFRAEAGQGQAAPGRPERGVTLLERVLARGVPQAAATQRRSLAQALFEGHWEQAERELDQLAEAEPAGAALADLIERIVSGIGRSGRQWTSARRKESLQRVLGGSRIDAQLLQRRLSQLVASWDGEGGESDEPESLVDPSATPATAASTPAGAAWAHVVARLAASLQAALGQGPDTAVPPAVAAEWLRAASADAPTPELVASAGELCERVERALAQRERLVGQLAGMCVELTEGLADLAEDDSWARGQIEAMRQTFEHGVTSRGVRAAGELLRKTREQQVRLRDERAQARDALKVLMSQMLQELGDLGSRTGRFHESVGRYADVIDRAESLESLTGVVGEMLSETRSVQELVGQTQTRLQTEHARATALTDRVAELESELRRLSDEVSTDQLTQVANRRGLPFLRLDHDAREVFSKWHADLQGELRAAEAEGLEAALSKFRHHVPALALLLHVIDGGTGPANNQSPLLCPIGARDPLCFLPLSTIPRKPG